ncbi:hypothetical protein [Saccharothrix hoggarensis]
MGDGVDRWFAGTPCEECEGSGEVDPAAYSDEWDDEDDDYEDD